MENIIALCKRKGFIFPGSEIYGGLSGTWDYGPLGLALKNNIKGLWWKRFVLDREDMYGVDAAILMNQNVWKASGHVGGFADPLVECLNCNKRSRVDNIIDENKYKEFIKFLEKEYNNHDDKGSFEEQLSAHDLKSLDPSVRATIKTQVSQKFNKGFSDAKKYVGIHAQAFLEQNNVLCGNCGKCKWAEPRQFNMMFKTSVGPMADDDSISYLRPETAQGMFVNFKNILDTMHPKIPFGMAQIGKAFRNEIAPRDFIFRTREFEQMEIEYFVHPDGWKDAFEHFRTEVWNYTKDIGLSEDRVHELEVADEDLAHYSKRTIDFEFDYPFGKKELYGLAYRTDFDLKSHTDASGQDLSFFDEEAKQRYLPHCIEPSFGVDRTVLAVLANAYTQDEIGGEKREYLKLSPHVAPTLVAVSPLLKNKPQLVEASRKVYYDLKKKFGRVAFDDNGNIGKRYRRQDEVGTPYCVVIDFDTIEGGEDGSLKDTVTVRFRDSGRQERVAIADLSEKLASYIQDLVVS